MSHQQSVAKLGPGHHWRRSAHCGLSRIGGRLHARGVVMRKPVCLSGWFWFRTRSFPLMLLASSGRCWDPVATAEPLARAWQNMAPMFDEAFGIGPA